MDGEQSADVLEELLAVKGKHLLHTAVLLAGGQDDGEDLLQAALERVFRRWRTIRGNPEGYLRRTLYHLAADGWRRQQAWRARLGLLGQPGAQPDETGTVDTRDQLLRQLRQLPARQRTAIVLRYWEELTEAQVAQAMGCVPRARSNPLPHAACASSANSTASAKTMARRNRQGERHEHRLRAAAAGRDGTHRRASAAGPGEGCAPQVPRQTPQDTGGGRCCHCRGYRRRDRGRCRSSHGVPYRDPGADDRIRPQPRQQCARRNQPDYVHHDHDHHFRPAGNHAVRHRRLGLRQPGSAGR